MLNYPLILWRLWSCLKWYLCIWTDEVGLYLISLWTNHNFCRRLNLQALVQCLLLLKKPMELKKTKHQNPNQQASFSSYTFNSTQTPSF